MSNTAAPDRAQTTPAPQGARPERPVPGRGLAVAGLILAFVVPLIGLILSIVAAVRLGRRGAPRGVAVAGVVIGGILTVVGVVVGVVAAVTISNLLTLCAELGPGVWDVDGVTYTCG